MHDASPSLARWLDPSRIQTRDSDYSATNGISVQFESVTFTSTSNTDPEIRTSLAILAKNRLFCRWILGGWMSTRVIFSSMCTSPWRSVKARQLRITGVARLTKSLHWYSRKLAKEDRRGDRWKTVALRQLHLNMDFDR